MVYQYLMGPQGQAVMRAGQRAVGPLQRFASGVMRGPKFAGSGSTNTPTGDYGFSFAGRPQQPSFSPNPAAMPARAAGGLQSPDMTNGSSPPQALWDELTARGAGGAVDTRSPSGGATLMDLIMQDRSKGRESAFGLQGPNMPAAPVYNYATPEYSGAPGYEGAAGALVPTAASVRGQTPPMPMPRPKDLPGRTPGFLDQLLSGPDYQSNNMPVNVQAAGPAMQGQQMPNVAINWGDAQNPADFFRASQMLQQNPGLLGGG